MDIETADRLCGDGVRVIRGEALARLRLWSAQDTFTFVRVPAEVLRHLAESCTHAADEIDRRQARRGAPVRAALAGE